MTPRELSARIDQEIHECRFDHDAQYRAFVLSSENSKRARRHRRWVKINRLFETWILPLIMAVAVLVIIWGPT